MQATAAVLRELDEPLSIEEIEVGELGDGEILVRISGAGICHTDISAAHGTIPLPLPSVLGHEGAGVVEQVGCGVEKLAIGDHVALSFDHCGDCKRCASGHPAYCEVFGALNYFGRRMDGTVTLGKDEEEIHGSWFGQSSFASYAIANEHNAVRVPTDLPLEMLGPLGCGLQTGAGSVFNVMQPRSGQGIGVFGLGGVGLGAVMAARAVGCDPIVVFDLNEARLELAKELGATHAFNPSEHRDLLWDVQLAVMPLDFTFDSVGVGSVTRQAIEMLATPGHCVTVGFQGLQNEITVDQGFLLIGRTLSGVIEGDADPQTMIPKLIELHRAGKFPFERLVKTYALEEINEAIADSEAGVVIKPVIVFD
jgi:aryl-alcohol dehydrogenase